MSKQTPRREEAKQTNIETEKINIVRNIVLIIVAVAAILIGLFKIFITIFKYPGILLWLIVAIPILCVAARYLIKQIDEWVKSRWR